MDQPPAKVRKLDQTDEPMDTEDGQIVLVTTQKNPDILKNRNFKINSSFILKFSEINAWAPGSTINCKILEFDKDFETFDNDNFLKNLHPEYFPNLFIFIIESESFNFDGQSTSQARQDYREIQNKLIEKFKNNRPMLIQMRSKVEDLTKFFFKSQTSAIFNEIKLNVVVDDPKDFPSFFFHHFINGTINNIDTLPIEKFENSPLILKFLRCFQINEEFWNSMLLKCTCYGTKDQFLAVFDDSFESKGKFMNSEMESMLSKTHDMNFCYVSKHKLQQQSILSIAVENNNMEVIHFLINNSHIVRKLPFSHQIEISKTAFNSSKQGIFCNLLEFADFPFPDSFNNINSNNDRINTIYNDRKTLYTAIDDENLNEIEKFIEKYSYLKIAYNTINNESGLFYAAKNLKIKSYCFLKSHGFTTSNNQMEENYDQIFTDVEREEITNINVNCSSSNGNKVTRLLTSRSIIYNKSISRELQKEYYSKIQNWYEAIYASKYVDEEYGADLLNVVSQCEDLVIIFDFSSKWVNKMDLINREIALGIIHIDRKWIFIGADTSNDENQENLIKGTIAHEFCHYAMQLLFENNAKPYFHEKNNKFEEIVKKTRIIKDECDGIISRVYNRYKEEVHHQELIVRVPQILVQFHGRDDKIDKIISTYDLLFDFYRNNILSALKNFSLELNLKVKKFNAIIGLLPNILNSRIELILPWDVPLNHQITTITTNTPMILLYNIADCLRQKYGSLFDTKCIFITLGDLNIVGRRDELKKILEKSSEINVVIDCSNGCRNCDFNEILHENSKIKFCFVGFTNSGLERFLETLPKLLNRSHNSEHFYNWRELKIQSQGSLLQASAALQSSESYPLFNLILNENYTPAPTSSNQIISQTIFSRTCIPRIQFGNKSFIISSVNQAGIILPESYVESKELSITNEANEKLSHEKNKIEEFADIVDDEFLNILIKNALNESERIQINLKVGTEKPQKMISRCRNFIKYYTKEVTKEMSKDELDLFIQRKKEITIKNIPNDKFEVKYCVDMTEEIFKNDQLEEVKNKKIVLISDIAGSGKSWILKEIAYLLIANYPRKWVSFVDLKLFIKEFLNHKEIFNFPSFMTDKILKSTHKKFELEIFKNLYTKGKVIILFDGFDEISPNCAESVTKLFRSFEFNNGNQMWITTRDFFEVNLKKELKLNAIYKLDEFTDDDGVQLITSSWIMKEMSEKIGIFTDEDFHNQIKGSLNYAKYKKLAENLIEKIPNSDNKSIGHPQLFQMLAEIFIDNKSGDHVFTIYKIYSEFADKKYDIWAYHGGDLRKNENKRVQHMDMKYFDLHQYQAMKNILNIQENDICHLSFDAGDWPDEKIIACGFLKGGHGKFFFPHKTYEEFFAVDFIMKIIKYKSKYDQNKEKIIKYIIEFLSNAEYKVIRMFINDALYDCTANTNFSNLIDDVAVQAVKRDKEIFRLIFTEGHENLANFYIKVLKTMDYDNAKSIFYGNEVTIWYERKVNITRIIEDTNNSKVFSILQKFIFETLNVNDLKELFIECDFFKRIAISRLNAVVLTEMISEIVEKLGEDFLKQSLIRNDFELLYQMIYSQYFDGEKFSKMLEIINNYLVPVDVGKMLIQKSNISVNIIQESINIGKGNCLIVLWRVIQKYFSACFNDLIKQKCPNFKNRNFLHIAAFSRGRMKLHEALWEVLLETFQDREKLTEMILEKDSDDNNFIHILVTFREADIINFTFEILKSNLNDDQYRRVLTSKGFRGRNLMQKAADYSENVESHAALWKIVRESYESDEEFFEMLKEDCDERANNILLIAASFSTKEVFEFMIKFIEQLNLKSRNDKIKSILSSKNEMFNDDLLQSAKRLNKSAGIYESLYKVFQKYFKL